MLLGAVAARSIKRTARRRARSSGGARTAAPSSRSWTEAKLMGADMSAFAWSLGVGARISCFARLSLQSDRSPASRAGRLAGNTGITGPPNNQIARKPSTRSHELVVVAGARQTISLHHSFASNSGAPNFGQQARRRRRRAQFCPWPPRAIVATELMAQNPAARLFARPERAELQAARARAPARTEADRIR